MPFLDDVKKFAGAELRNKLRNVLRPSLVLGGIDLIKRVQLGERVEEIRSVHNVSISGRRRIVELQIPGSKGNVFQDMGRIPLRISFDGELAGPTAGRALVDIASKFELSKPVSFSSSLAVLNDITEVVIDSFNVSFMDGVPDGSRYSVVLRECKSKNTSGKKLSTETEPPDQEEKGESEFFSRLTTMGVHVADEKAKEKISSYD